MAVAGETNFEQACDIFIAFYNDDVSNLTGAPQLGCCAHCGNSTRIVTRQELREHIDTPERVSKHSSGDSVRDRMASGRARALRAARWVAGLLLVAVLVVASDRGVRAAENVKGSKRYVSSQAYFHALRAELAFAERDLSTAADELQLALVYDPESVLLTERLARLALSTDRLKKARRLVERARDLAPKRVRLLLLESEVALQAGEVARAERALRRAVARGRFTVEPAVALAAFLAKRGRVHEAGQVLSRAAARVPQDPRPLDALGDLEARRGRYWPAVRALERAIRRDPKSLPRRIELDRLYVRLGRFRDAAHMWATYAREDARDAEALERAVRAHFRAGQPEGGRRLAIRWRLAAPGDATELAIADTLAAEGYWAEAVATWENREVSTELMPSRDLAYARALVVVGRIEDALGALSRIPRTSQNYVEARMAMATVLARSGQPMRAAEILEGVLEIDVEDPEVGLRLSMLRPVLEVADTPSSLGLVAERAGRLARGAGLKTVDAFLEAFLKEQPHRGPELRTLRVALWQVYAEEVPVEIFESAFNVHPERVRLKAALGRALVEAKSTTSRARRLAEAALASAPDDPEVLAAAGFVALRRGARRHAEECLERAVRLSPESTAAWEIFGDVLIARGRLEAARAAYREARRAARRAPWLGPVPRRAAVERLTTKLQLTSRRSAR